MLILTSGTVYAVPSSINAPVSGSWGYNQHKPGGYYLGIGGTNDGYAWDINYGNGYEDEGMPVYAVESGCIYTGNGWGGNSYGQLLINHTTGSDKWSSGYLHMKNIVKKSGCVSKGDKIGEVSRTGYLVNSAITTPHLHFAVYNSNGKYGLTSVNVNINEVTYPLSSYIPYFDGTGSIIDPQSGCGYGCDKDSVQLHSHGQQNSAGFFQVYRIPNSCEAVELDGLAYAEVEVRSWAGYGTDSEYYTLNSLPAVVPLNTPWSLIAVKTVSPIPAGSTRTLNATCIAQSYNDPNVSKKSSGSPMKFDSDYYWGGNGSIINHSNNQYDSDTQAGYGRDRDTVVLFRDKKTLSASQVTNTDSCRSIKFSTPVPIELSWKRWDDESWWGTTTITDGNSFRFPTTDSWWILKVKANATGSNNTMVDAVCEP